MGAAADVKADLAKAYPKGAPHDDVVLTNDYQEQQSGSDKAGDKTINYQTTSWPSTAVLLAKAQIGLGVLSLPQALNILGGFYGLLAIVVVGVVTTYANFVTGAFIIKRNDVHSPADAGRIMYGRFGAEFLGVCFWLLHVCVAGSGFLATSIGLNTFSNTNTCTVVWVVVAAVIAVIFAALPKFQYIAWTGWLGLPCIIVSIIVLMGVVGSSDKPPLAPEGDYDRKLAAFGSPSIVDAFVALVDILFAFAGTPSYFLILNEMSNKRDYPKAMLLSQGFCISFYIVVSAVVWRYCGQYIASPALGSAGDYYQIVCYGLAFPGLEAGAIIILHVSSKYLFVRAFRGTRHLDHQTVIHWVGWLTCVVICAIIGFVIAEAVPFFSTLLGLLGALFASIFCMILPALMWYHDHKSRERTWKWKLVAALDLFMFLLGLFLLGAGTWACAESIKSSYSSGDVGTPFSCSDNS